MNVDPTKRKGDAGSSGDRSVAGGSERDSDAQVPDAFEAALGRAMHRREAVSPELTTRLLAIAGEPGPQADQARRSKRQGFWHMFRLPELPLWAAGAVAAILVLVVSLAGGTAVHVRQQQHARAAQATRNFELATSIEDKALEHTRQQLREAGVPLEH